MEGFSLNITANLLHVASIFIITGSNTWMLIFEPSPYHVKTVAYSNIAAVFSITIGVILTQVNICQKNRELKSIKYNESNV
jgi:hypothetical protein